MKRPRWARAGLVLVALCAATVGIAGDPVRLIDAVRAGDRGTVRALLRAKVDVNAAEADGTTALHVAVQANDVDTTRMLLAAGANARSANHYGSTPVVVAATNGNAALIEM